MLCIFLFALYTYVAKFELKNTVKNNYCYLAISCSSDLKAFKKIPKPSDKLFAKFGYKMSVKIGLI